MTEDAKNVSENQALNPVDIDLEALREKYRAERDKRLRSDNIDQYIEPTSEVVEDPWVDHDFSRAPVTSDVDVLIIGGGISGLSAGAQLRKAGIDDFRIIEKGGDFGGTWYWNRYPGAQCDVESYLYFPFLEETGYMPTLRYAYQPEILTHLQRVAKHFDLYPRALFQTAVASLTWLDDENIWLVTTDRNDRFKARDIIKTTSVLDKPKFPGIPGIDDFKGNKFHTSRWDYAYTGGDSQGGMIGLADKKVALIGTGATAIQCAPYVAKSAAHLYVVQRTPSSIDLRRNKETDPEWAASLNPGWQRERQENFVQVTTFRPVEDRIQDGWTLGAIAVGGFSMGLADTDESPQAIEARRELADARWMTDLRRRIDETVQDPETAESLKPWYRLLCKRPTFNDEYLAMFNRPNVSLVDTHGHGVESFSETGLTVNGVHYEVDCVVFATGFEVGTSFTRRSGFEIIGRDGLKLSDAWKDGMQTLHGCYSHGFPNLFHMGTGQNASHQNRTYPIGNQARHIVAILKAARERGAVYVEAELGAQSQWAELLRAGSQKTIEFFDQCTPGYFNNEGRKSTGTELIANLYSAGPLEFDKMLEGWRAEGFAGLKFGRSE